MKIFKITAVLAVVLAVNSIVFAIPTQVQGNNYRQFANYYTAYPFNQYGQVDSQWVSGAVNGLRQDGMYNVNNFLNILWSDLDALVNYYAPGNQSFRQATYQSLVNVYNNLMGSYQAPQRQQSMQVTQQAQQPEMFDIRSLMNGAIDGDIAKKTSDIYRYDYTKATKRGDKALVGELQDAIKDTNLNPYASDRIERLRIEINKLYNILVQYRFRDVAGVAAPVSARVEPQASSSAPVGIVTYELVLGGFLGEPYTSKVVEIARSQNQKYSQFYKDKLRADINYLGRATNVAETDKINGIKVKIDNTYSDFKKMGY